MAGITVRCRLCLEPLFYNSMARPKWQHLMNINLRFVHYIAGEAVHSWWGSESASTWNLGVSQDFCNIYGPGGELIHAGYNSV